MPEDLTAAMAAESSRIEEDALYSARGHFEAARRWRKAHFMLGIPTSLLAALAGASAFRSYELLAGVLAVIVAALSAVTTFLNPNARADRHHTAGSRFNTIRNEARLFREVELV